MKGQIMRKPRYLLIDDDTCFGKVIQRQARVMGANVFHIPSISKVKNFGQLHSYDAVLVDYDLADMTGFEVAEFLNKHLRGTPIVMVSSTNRPYQDRRAKLSNIAGFVSKWSNSYQFVLNISDVLQRRPGITLSK